MLGFALIVALVAFAAGVAASLAARRRRAEPLALAPRRGTRPPGVRHLAASVSELSDLEIHLPVPGGAVSRKGRLGILLGPR